MREGASSWSYCPIRACSSSKLGPYWPAWCLAYNRCRNSAEGGNGWSSKLFFYLDSSLFLSFLSLCWNMSALPNQGSINAFEATPVVFWFFLPCSLIRFLSSEWTLTAAQGPGHGCIQDIDIFDSSSVKPVTQSQSTQMSHSQLYVDLTQECLHESKSNIWITEFTEWIKGYPCAWCAWEFQHTVTNYSLDWMGTQILHLTASGWN